MAGTLKLTQVRSPAGRPANQRATLVALKLNKQRRTSLVEDTVENRGRIATVRHLIEVEPVDSED